MERIIEIKIGNETIRKSALEVRENLGLIVKAGEEEKALKEMILKCLSSLEDLNNER